MPFNMNINTLIKKYEDKLEARKKLQQQTGHNDVVEGVIITLELVIEDLKKLKQTNTL
jgi:hypothetical protein